MKTKKKPKSKSVRKAARLPLGMQKTHSVPKSRVPNEKPQNVFTPMETGQPDQDLVAGSDNPRSAQGGLGPLNQEGEGESQNDQLAALEQIEPEE
ncbi:MAG: hypothetical protein PHS14_09225 [Elusimicrobia bacterium]|nr:hypothetical protein [Elusimicrobiota bacterium]